MPQRPSRQRSMRLERAQPLLDLSTPSPNSPRRSSNDEGRMNAPTPWGRYARLEATSEDASLYEAASDEEALYQQDPSQDAEPAAQEYWEEDRERVWEHEQQQEEEEEEEEAASEPEAWAAWDEENQEAALLDEPTARRTAIWRTRRAAGHLPGQDNLHSNPTRPLPLSALMSEQEHKADGEADVPARAPASSPMVDLSLLEHLHFLPGRFRQRHQGRIPGWTRYMLVFGALSLSLLIAAISLAPLTPAISPLAYFSGLISGAAPPTLPPLPPGETYLIPPPGWSGPAFPQPSLWDTKVGYYTTNGIAGTGHLHHPIEGALISQYFGTPEYQWWCGCWAPHTGVDLAAPFGTPIMAADGGQVVWVGWDSSGLGWAVKINHGRDFATIYGHTARVIVKVGQTVAQGQVIAYVGSTGQSTGPHCHFMVLFNNQIVDPMRFVALP